MKLARTFVGLLLLGTIGCTAYPTYRPNVPIGCDVEAQYQLETIAAFDEVSLMPEACTVPPPPLDGMAPECPGWASADGSPGAFINRAVVEIPDGSRCGSTAALRIRTDKNHDWGSLFGDLSLGTGRDASAYEGLSFWARAGYNTNTGFTILLDDPNTKNPDAVCPAAAGVAPSPADAGVCREYCIDGGTATGNTDPGTGMIIPGTVSTAPEPDQCGNGYSTVTTVTSWWRFYTIPFSRFQQGATPNRVPNAVLTQTGTAPGTALRTSQLKNLVFRLPKAMRTELWIDNLGFYRKATATGGDGGGDAPQM